MADETLHAHVDRFIARLDAIPELPGRAELAPCIRGLGERVATRPLDLTYMEYELLKFLSGNPGRVFTRDSLLSQVWGYEYAGETRTVDVHVHWLRSVIEPDPASPALVQTVRGVGYVFRRPA